MRLSHRLPTILTRPAPGGESVALVLSEHTRSLDSWRMRVSCRTAEGVALVGSVRSLPALRTGEASRVVAIASCPGASEWIVEASHVAVTPLVGESPFGVADGAEALLGLSAGPGVAAAGLVPLAGELDTFGPLAEYTYETGTDGTVSVPAGLHVWSWSAFATGALATVGINGGADIPVPEGGSVIGEPRGRLRGPCELVFTGTAGYLVELTR